MRETLTEHVQLYIVLFLHQTTTSAIKEEHVNSCISYYSYIKPQQHLQVRNTSASCISYYSYIKPQLQENYISYLLVVYRTIPTSNHNWQSASLPAFVLYIVLFLHQTTTVLGGFGLQVRCISYYSYIKPQLIKNVASY